MLLLHFLEQEWRVPTLSTLAVCTMRIRKVSVRSLAPLIPELRLLRSAMALGPLLHP